MKPLILFNWVKQFFVVTYDILQDNHISSLYSITTAGCHILYGGDFFVPRDTYQFRTHMLNARRLTESLKARLGHYIQQTVALLLAFLFLLPLYRGLSTHILAAGQYALNFDGNNRYVSFNDTPDFHLQTFTVEFWAKFDTVESTQYLVQEGDTGNGVKEGWKIRLDGPTRKMTFQVVEDSNTEVQVVSNNALSSDTWYHIAGIIDGGTISIYIDGIRQDSTNSVIDIPYGLDPLRIGAGLSQPATVAPTNGTIDEVRIWSVARTQQQIEDNMNIEIESADGLVGRWGFSEGSGATVGDSSGNSHDGTITGATWVEGKNLTGNQSPDPPQLLYPENGSSDIDIPPTLDVTVSDPEGDAMNVRFFGRPMPSDSDSFTLVALPDTQIYTENYPEVFDSQTQWIVGNVDDLNIAFVTHLGDIVQSDNNETEWQNADSSMSLLDGVVPWGILPGNHDMDSNGVATLYNQYFPSSRHENEPWWGGSFNDNKNNYQLFSAGGQDFIIVHLEYCPTDLTLDWANDVLAAYPERSAVISTHAYLDNGVRSTHDSNASCDQLPSEGNNAGEDIWEKLVVPNLNVFLVLNGHFHGQSRLISGREGQDVFQLHLDRANSQGWLLILEFHPNDNRIDVKTYSPYLDQYDTGANSQYSLDYVMTPEFTELGEQAGVTDGTSATYTWSDLLTGTNYEWYVTVDDGTTLTTGPIWTFTTTNDTSSLPISTPTHSYSISADRNVFGTSSDTKPSSCSQQAPGNAPDLFQIDRTVRSAKLYFAPAGQPYNKYIVAYGIGDSTEQYGVQFDQGYSSGVIDYTINELDPNTDYSFKVQAANGCATGEWSNVLKVGAVYSAKQSYYRVGGSSVSSSNMSLVSAPRISEAVSTPEPTSPPANKNFDESPRENPEPSSAAPSPQPTPPEKSGGLWQWFWGLFR